MSGKTTQSLLVLLFINLAMAPLAGQDYLTETQREKNNYFLLVPFYFHQGMPDRAEALIDEFLEKYPRDPIMLTEKAVLLTQFRNKPDEALEFIKKAKEIVPGYYYSNFLHASILFTKFLTSRKGESALLEEAATHLEISIQDNEQLFESLYLAGIVQSELNNPEKSNHYFTLAVTLRETLPVYIYMAYNYKKTGELQKELDTYHNILRIDPRNEQVKKPLAEAYLYKKEYYLSYQTLLEVEEKNRDAKYYSLLLELYSRFNLNERIIQTFQVLTKDDEVLKQLTPANIFTIVYAFGSLGRFQEARYALIVAEGIFKQQKDLFNDMAGVIKLFLEEREINPADARYNYSLYVILHFYKTQKRYGEAIGLITKILAQKNELGISLELCDILLEQGETKKAEALLLRLQKDHGGSSVWQNFYAYFLAMNDTSLQHASEFSKATLEKDGDSPAYLDTYGYILIKMKKYDEALKYLQKAYEKNPFDKEIIEHIVECFQSRHEQKKIRAVYELAIEHDVDFKADLQRKLEHVD